VSKGRKFVFLQINVEERCHFLKTNTANILEIAPFLTSDGKL
jgi:hypothetical protein